MDSYFKDSEFVCKHCGELPKGGMDWDLVNLLNLIRKHFGKPVIVTSAYRCPTHNRNVGGVADSQHVFGKAADIYIDGVSPRELARVARLLGAHGVGIYKSGFVHVDTRGYEVYWED